MESLVTKKKCNLGHEHEVVRELKAGDWVLGNITGRIIYVRKVGDKLRTSPICSDVPEVVVTQEYKPENQSLISPFEAAALMFKLPVEDGKWLEERVRERKGEKAVRVWRPVKNCQGISLKRLLHGGSPEYLNEDGAWVKSLNSLPDLENNANFVELHGPELAAFLAAHPVKEGAASQVAGKGDGQ